MSEGKFDPNSYVVIFRRDIVPTIMESLEGVVARLEQRIQNSKSPTEAINLFVATTQLTTELGNDKVICNYIRKVEQIQGVTELTEFKVPGKCQVIYKGNYSHIGEVLLDFRRQAGLSQQEVADFLSINQSHLARLEKGFRKGFGAKYLKKLLSLFEIYPKQRIEDILELIEQPRKEREDTKYLENK